MKVEGDFSRIKIPLHLEKMASVFFLNPIPRDYAVHFNGAQGTYSVCLKNEDEHSRPPRR